MGQDSIPPKYISLEMTSLYFYKRVNLHIEYRRVMLLIWQTEIISKDVKFVSEGCEHKLRCDSE